MSSDSKRAAIVTGAVGNIGSAVTRRLADDGFAVVLVDVSQEKIDASVEGIVSRGGRAIGFPADVRSRADMQHVVAEAAGRFEGVDALVNIVGHSGSKRVSDIEDIDDEL